MNCGWMSASQWDLGYNCIASTPIRPKLPNLLFTLFQITELAVANIQYTLHLVRSLLNTEALYNPKIEYQTSNASLVNATSYFKMTASHR